MSEKVIVIGTNHAGTNFLTYLKDNLKSDIEAVTYDQNDNISFLGCGMALWISDVINKPDGLFYATPEILKEKGIKVNMKHRLIDVDFDRKKVVFENIDTKEKVTDNYDKLVISVGSWPILPNLKGIELNNVCIAKLYQNAKDIINKIKSNQQGEIKKIAVIGAGYIGVELAEAFYKNGKEVLLLNDQDILNYYYDSEMQKLMYDNLSRKINVSIGEKLVEILGDDNNNVKAITTDKGNIYDVDMVLICVGHKPNTDIFKNTKLKLNDNGSIKVNNKQETNIENVYAIGDCCDIQHNSLDKKRTSVMLATNAVRTGVVAAMNISGMEIMHPGVQGSNAIHIFGFTMCSTGITKRVAEENNINYDSVYVEELLRPEFMPNNNKVYLQIVWNKDSRKIIGAQIASCEDITLALHMFSLAIEVGYTIDQLALLDLFFLPHFNKPINFVSKAAIIAINKK